MDKARWSRHRRSLLRTEDEIEEEDKRISATAHLYGVSLVAQILAKKRGLDPELAVLERYDI